MNMVTCWESRKKRSKLMEVCGLVVLVTVLNLSARRDGFQQVGSLIPPSIRLASSSSDHLQDTGQ